MKKFSLLSQDYVMCMMPLWMGNNEISQMKSFIVEFIVLIGIVVFYWLYSNQVVPSKFQVMLKSDMSLSNCKFINNKWFYVMDFLKKMKKMKLYYSVYESSWPLANPMGVMLLTVGFACNSYKSFMSFILVKKVNCSFVNQKKFYSGFNMLSLNSFLLKFNMSSNLFVNKFLSSRYYCMFNYTRHKKLYMKGSVEDLMSRHEKGHPTIGNFVEDIDNGDILFVNMTTTTCNKSGGPLVLQDFYGKPAYLFNGKKDLFMKKIKTLEDLNLVKNMMNDYKVDLMNSKMLNSNVAKDMMQPFVMNKMKEKKNMNVKYMKEDMNIMEDSDFVLNEMENRMKNEFTSMEKKMD